MITLEVLGALAACPTFGQAEVDIALIRKVYCADYYDVDFYRDIQTLASRQGRADIATAIEQSLRSSVRVSRYLHLLRRLKTRPFARRVAGRLESAVLAGRISS